MNKGNENYNENEPSKKFTCYAVAAFIMACSNMYRLFTGEETDVSLLVGTIIMISFALGEFVSGKTSDKDDKKIRHEFGGKDIQNLLLSNKEILPTDIQKSMELGANIRFSIKAEYDVFKVDAHTDNSCTTTTK